jgi:methyl-accepting chemotaxis protein
VVIGLAWITRGMAQSLNGRLALAASVAARVAEGDLTVRVPETGTTDESGRLLAAIQTMTANLHNLVARVRQTSLNLGESAIEFSLSGKRQETSVGGLRDSAVQIAGTARGISDTSSVLMTTMDAVNTVASHTAQVASGGRSSLDELNGAMQELQQATSSISTRASALFAKRPPTSAASSRRSPRSPIRPICFPSMPPSKRKKPAIKASDS